MRGNTNPCVLCKHCDDSCDVCLHQPYENVDSSYFYGDSSSDESDYGNVSTDIDSASDEEGSWFTTPWSKLIAQRVAGYEVDPEIGVQLTPLEEPVDEGARGNRTEEEQAENQEETHKKSRRRRVRRRRRRHSTPGPREEEAVKEEGQECRNEESVKADECGGEDTVKDGVERLGDETVKELVEERREEKIVQDAEEVSQGDEIVKDEAEQCQGEETAKDEVQTEEALQGKDSRENSWRESVESCVPLVTAS